MSTQSKKILLIEDDKSLLSLLTDALKQENFLVLMATDGEEGLRVALEERPDLILLDLILPRLDGLTMLKRLRDTDQGKDVPVIVLSNLSDAEEVSKAMESGAYDFLVKSDWKMEDVVEKVKRRLGVQ